MSRTENRASSCHDRRGTAISICMGTYNTLLQTHHYRFHACDTLLCLLYVALTFPEQDDSLDASKRAGHASFETE